MSPTTSRMGHIKVASRYLQRPFAVKLIEELKETGHTDSQAEALVIRLFNKTASNEERFPPSIVRIFERTESAPMLALRRAAEIAVSVGCKEVTKEHAPQINEAIDIILRHITASVKQARPLTEGVARARSEEHTSELQSRENLVCR